VNGKDTPVAGVNDFVCMIYIEDGNVAVSSLNVKITLWLSHRCRQRNQVIGYTSTGGLVDTAYKPIFTVTSGV
jgi:hypothetical protein